MRKWYMLLFMIWVLAQISLAHAELAVPRLAGRVNDYAGVLKPEERINLESMLAEYEKATSNQVVILTVKSLEGDPIEDFGIRVASAWKVGQKGKDNGVIIIHSVGDREIRIEVGYGLEGALPDLVANRIIREVMGPAFRENRFFQGYAGAIQKIEAAARGEYTADNREKGQGRGKEGSPLLMFLVVAAMLTIMFGQRSRIAGGFFGSLLFGLAFWIGLAGLIWGVMGAIIGLIFGILVPSAVASGSSGGRGGWGGGPFFGGGRGGGFGGRGGGGGFSGGGGGFGGGGSSGRY